MSSIDRDPVSRPLSLSEQNSELVTNLRNRLIYSQQEIMILKDSLLGENVRFYKLSLRGAETAQKALKHADKLGLL